jgi:nucleotide-binding universal stress UspA family protein
MNRVVERTAADLDWSTDSVVVGFDDSRYSLLALDAAADCAMLRHAPLVILHIGAPSPVWNDGLEDLYRDSSRESRDAHAATSHALDRVGRRQPDLPVSLVQAHQVGGESLRALAATTLLLVLGQRGAHGQRVLAMGSASEAIARAFSCPLLVVHDGYEVPQNRDSDYVSSGRVVAGVDGHEDSDAILTVALHEAELRERPLVIVHSASATGGVNHLTSKSIRAVRSAEKRLTTGSVAHSIVVCDDEPLAALVDRVSSLDLIVVGTRGGGRLSGLVQGSVSRAVLSAAPCDVLVVQPLAESSAAPERRTGLDVLRSG